MFVLLHATVIGFDTGDGGFAVTGVRVATPRGELRVEASVVVLAAGGIENARLLLLSGLGNQRDLVGRFFMEHPYVASGLLHPAGAGRETAFYHRHQEGGTRISGVFTLREELLRRERLVNAAIFLRARGQGHLVTETEAVHSIEVLAAALRRGAVPPRAGRRLATALARPDRLAFAAALRLGLIGGGPIGLRAFTEPVPDPANRVTLTDERDRLGRPRVRVAWRMCELERRSLARIHELLDQALRDRGLGGLELRAAEPAGVGHHIGTTRMHRDPARGVVDEHCRVHGVANLFLAGSSVFPAAGLANPTLTIIALALRLADRIDQSLRSGVPAARSG
jgi:choline dehydrogenase-like flavoprotein